MNHILKYTYKYKEVMLGIITEDFIKKIRKKERKK